MEDRIWIELRAFAVTLLLPLELDPELWIHPPLTKMGSEEGRREETREATNKMISVSSVRQSVASIARLQVMGDIGRLVVSDVRC